MQNKKKKTNQTILRGIVLPTQWDDEGNVMRIAINTHDEKEYFIDFSGRGKELFGHLKEFVEVDGKIRENIGGHSYIKVNNYTVLEKNELYII
jgi:hypothetical protein